MDKLDAELSAISFEECFFGSATVGERGQVVIPSDIRKDLGIHPGDRLLVFRHPLGKGLLLAKIDCVQDVIRSFQAALSDLDAIPDSTTEEEKN